MRKADLGAASNSELFAELGKRRSLGSITQVEYFAAMDAAPANPTSNSRPVNLSGAAARWARRDARETLYELEKALGRDFLGLADLKPEQIA